MNVIEPLSKEEWINFVRVIDATKGVGFFQLLPLGQRSTIPYQFNMLHVLPKDKWPYPHLPIDIFISNQVTHMKRVEQEEERMRLTGKLRRRKKEGEGEEAEEVQ